MRPTSTETYESGAVKKISVTEQEDGSTKFFIELNSQALLEGVLSRFSARTPPLPDHMIENDSVKNVYSVTFKIPHARKEEFLHSIQCHLCAIDRYFSSRILEVLEFQTEVDRAFDRENSTLVHAMLSLQCSGVHVGMQNRYPEMKSIIYNKLIELNCYRNTSDLTAALDSGNRWIFKKEPLSFFDLAKTNEASFLKKEDVTEEDLCSYIKSYALVKERNHIEAAQQIIFDFIMSLDLVSFSEDTQLYLRGARIQAAVKLNMHHEAGMFLSELCGNAFGGATFPIMENISQQSLFDQIISMATHMHTLNRTIHKLTLQNAGLKNNATGSPTFFASSLSKTTHNELKNNSDNLKSGLKNRSGDVMELSSNRQYLGYA